MSNMTHLDELEAEAIYIMREVVAECEKRSCFIPLAKTLPSCCIWLSKLFILKNRHFRFFT